MNASRNTGLPKPGLRCIFTSVLGCVLFLSGCVFLRPRNPDLTTNVNPGDQPDKILFEKALNEIKHGRFDVGRLTLQTLINTYPDSEFLSKAKLTIADSYYQQGGVSGLTQAEAEYKDFITFFPTAPEAPEAEFRAGMAHFRLVGKADRDEAEAQQAEAEFKEFLAKYPDSPLMPQVKGRLREAQEILAQGEYTVAKFYFDKGDSRAAQGRFQDIVDKYPNFSRADNSCWYLAKALVNLKKPQQAVPYLDRIVTEFPLSSRVDDAKQQLATLDQPVPHATKATLARAEADAAHHVHQSPLAKLSEPFSSSPDFSATRHGPVDLGHGKPGETQVAQTGAKPPFKGSLSAQPVSESSLKSGTPVDPVPAKAAAPAALASKSSTAPNASQPASTNQTNSPNTSSPQKKKKSRFHFLKKIVDPF